MRFYLKQSGIGIVYYSINQIYSSIKSFIMKKSILTLSMALFVMGTGLKAKEIKNFPVSISDDAIAKVAISSFCKAVIQGDMVTVDRLISLGEDVNQKSLGMTPAMYAARYNKVKILALLIAKGADLELKSNQGYSARKYAELSNAKEALEVIDNASLRL